MAKIVKTYWGIATSDKVCGMKLGDIRILGPHTFCKTKKDAIEDIRYQGEDDETPVKLRVTIEEV